MTAGLSGAFGKSAPAAADLENARAQGQPRQDTIILARLSGFQIIGVVGQSRGIAHARIRSELVEFIPDIAARRQRGKQRPVGDPDHGFRAI